MQREGVGDRLTHLFAPRLQIVKINIQLGRVTVPINSVGRQMQVDETNGMAIAR